MVTVGHGTLEADELTELLSSAGVQEVVDVRRYPGSRRNPQFATERMAEWLPDAGVGYRWVSQLGGRRRPDPDSPNVGLRNEQFRAYADHMASEEFGSGLAQLLSLAVDRRVAIMCSESVWWRCHRRLVADRLVLLDDISVVHLFHDGRLQPHPPTPGAVVEDGEVRYLPAES